MKFFFFAEESPKRGHPIAVVHNIFRSRSAFLRGKIRLSAAEVAQLELFASRIIGMSREMRVPFKYSLSIVRPYCSP